jgi:hypothetical protein
MMAQRILKSRQTPILRFLVYFHWFKDCVFIELGSNYLDERSGQTEDFEGNGFRTSFAFSFE